jgi:hypothetical protein
MTKATERAAAIREYKLLVKTAIDERQPTNRRSAALRDAQLIAHRHNLRRVG